MSKKVSIIVSILLNLFELHRQGLRFCIAFYWLLFERLVPSVGTKLYRRATDRKFIALWIALKVAFDASNTIATSSLNPHKSLILFAFNKIIR